MLVGDRMSLVNTVDANSTTKGNIVLTGFMGTGKSTVGRLLAEELGLDFVDSDDVLETEYGPIERIFAIDGEPGFRAKERAVALSLASLHGAVIATGGGMLLDPVSAEAFERHGTIFCLRAEPTEILLRVLGDTHVDRPLLNGPDPTNRILELLTEREQFYARFTQIITDDKTPTQVAAEICASILSTD